MSPPSLNPERSGGDEVGDETLESELTAGGVPDALQAQIQSKRDVNHPVTLENQDSSWGVAAVVGRGAGGATGACTTFAGALGGVEVMPAAGDAGAGGAAGAAAAGVGVVSICGDCGVMTASIWGSLGLPSTVVTWASGPDCIVAMVCSCCAVRASSRFSIRFVSLISFNMA